jgi:hypothetical protein
MLQAGGPENFNKPSVGIDLDQDSALQLQDSLRNSIHQRNAADDRSYRHDWLGAEVYHGRRGQAPLLELINNIRSNGGALAPRKDQHLSRYALAIKLVGGIDHHACLGIDIAEE